MKGITGDLQVIKVIKFKGTLTFPPCSIKVKVNSTNICVISLVRFSNDYRQMQSDHIL